MTFTLQYGRGIAVGMQTIINPSPEAIEQVISDLLPAADHYATLISEVPIENFEYVQTAINADDDAPEIEYLVEAHKKTDDSFIQYRQYIKNENEVKRIFRMFALERPPDVTSWEDVTKKIKSLPSIEEQREKLRKKTEHLNHKK